MSWVCLLLLFVSLCTINHVRSACKNDLECSLNGVCNGGSCQCDPQWKGNNCELLNLKPAPAGKSNGFQETNTSSWGGSVVKVGSQYHMYVSRMSDGCGLNCWQGNSEIAHAVSSNPLGPFVYQEIVLPYFAHGPTIHQLSDGTFLLFHLGCSTPDHPMPDHTPCKCPWHNGTSPENSLEKMGSLRAPLACGSDYIGLNTASSPSGPWTTVGQRNPKVKWASGTTNPGIFVYGNGSVLMAYRGNEATDAANERLGVAYASSWKSDYDDSRAVPIFTHGGEDPYIYLDKRGNYHIIYHDMDGSDKGGHGYSPDGITWYNGPTTCYTGEVQFDDGTSKKFKKRQRPQLIVEGGVPRYLYTSVMPGGNTGDYSYTLAQEIN